MFRVDRARLSCFTVASALVAITWASFAAVQVVGQAWTRPAGHAYVKLARSYTKANTRFDLAGERVAYSGSDPTAAYLDESFYLYAEYGLTEHLTAVALLPYKRVVIEGEPSNRSASRVGSLELGLRYGLQQRLGFSDDRHRVSVSANAVMPTGYVRNAVPSVGTGEAALDLQIAYGASAHPVPAYGQIATGYRLRSGASALSRSVECVDDATSDCSPDVVANLDNEWLLRAETGVALGTYVLLQAIVQGRWSNRSPESELNPDNPIATRQRFLQGGLGIGVYPVPWLGVSVQVFDKLSGKNTIDAADWFFGVELITDRR